MAPARVMGVTTGSPSTTWRRMTCSGRRAAGTHSLAVRRAPGWRAPVRKEGPVSWWGSARSPATPSGVETDPMVLPTPDGRVAEAGTGRGLSP